MKFRRRVSLRNIDVRKVMDALGIVYEKRGDELYSKCLHPEHKEKKPSWHIHAKLGDEKNGVFFCWSCGWRGNIVTLISAVKEVGFPAALAMVEEFQKFAPIDDSEISPADYENGMQSFGPSELKGFEWKGKKIRSCEIRTGSEAFDYLISREIGPRYIVECGLIDWPFVGRIIVPIHRDQKLISWVARSYREEMPKTIAPPGAPKRWELLGYDQFDRRVKEVNVCEGWVDRIRLLQIGCKNPCALCGSKMSEYQVEDLSFAEKITIWQDGDKAGDIMSRDLSAWLGRDRELFIVRFPKGKDPGSYSPSDLAEFKPVPWDQGKTKE